MAFLKNAQLEELVGSFTLKEPSLSLEWNKVIVRDSILLRDGNQKFISLDPLELFYKKNTEFSFISFSKKLHEELGKAGHKVTDRIIHIVSCFIAYSIDIGLDPFTTLDLLIKNIQTVDVSHFIVQSNSTFKKESLHWKDFNIGPLNLEKLEYRCSKAQCDYFQRYKDELKGALGIESPPHIGMAINFLSLKKFSQVKFTDEKGILLIEEYFQELSQIYLNEMWLSLETTQYLFTPHDLDFIDIKSLKGNPVARTITIFLASSNESWGFVSPSGVTLNINWLSPDSSIFQSALSLAEKFCFDDFHDTEIHQTIISFAHYLYMAKRAVDENRLSESFMNYMIALEIIFSERESTSLTISSRVAVVTYNKFNKSFIQMKKDISKLYDLRSNYVHKGITVDLGALAALKEIVVEVYCCLLRLQINQENQSHGFLNLWLKNIDWIKASLEAGQQINPNVYQTNGISVNSASVEA